jgi:hypothetical protein
MEQDQNERSVNQDEFVAADIVGVSERLVRSLSQTSAIGFAVLDSQLRYQAVNQCLAEINGLPAKAHLGVGIREIFGELAEKAAEPSYQRVLRRGEISHFEVNNAALPGRTDSYYCGLNINFPIRDQADRVNRIGILVVELTELRRLEMFCCALAAELRDVDTRQTFWVARELQDSIIQFHAALRLNMNLLIRQSQKPGTSDELLTQSVESLDQRILAMQKLVSAVARQFPIDK